MNHIGHCVIRFTIAEYKNKTTSSVSDLTPDGASQPRSPLGFRGSLPCLEDGAAARKPTGPAGPGRGRLERRCQTSGRAAPCPQRAAPANWVRRRRERTRHEVEPQFPHAMEQATLMWWRTAVGAGRSHGGQPPERERARNERRYKEM